MHKADELGFETSLSYSVISDHKPGKPIEYSGINNGDTVNLKYDEERVTVTDVKEIGTQCYQGIISGFEPSVSVSFKELKLGESIAFNEQHVFSCIRS